MQKSLKRFPISRTICELIRYTQYNAILGEERDPQANKTFLKTKFNRDKNNFRSPYTNILWPENLRHYTSPKVQQLEHYLTTFLENFQSLYYCGGTASGFVSEKGSESLTFNICVLKEYREEKDSFICTYSYKHVCQVLLVTSDIQRDSGFAFESRSTLIYEMSIENAGGGEKTSCSGQFLHSAQKNYLKNQKALGNEEIIEIVGSFFEKADCYLRTCFRNQLFKVLESKIQQFEEDSSQFKPDSSKLMAELRNLRTKIISNDNLKYVPLK